MASEGIARAHVGGGESEKKKGDCDEQQVEHQKVTTALASARSSWRSSSANTAAVDRS
jgi:hypothetical protein